MVTSLKRTWTQKVSTDESKVEEIAKELELSEVFVEICMQRGLTTAEEIKQFIEVDETWFHDPFLMHDMEKTVDRIEAAVMNNEQITVYGDYDADGMTSTALLTETLESIGANVNYYLPSRFKEGYGPNIEVFKTIIENGTTLIITVDNGVAGHEAISYAKNVGVDVIVTDHHELSDNLPEAYAIIHPNHPEGSYPFGELAGVGVAFKVAQALLGELPVEVLDLVAIGTVADLVSLTNENRALVVYGLKVLQQTQRIGLLQLFRIIDTSPADINEDTIGFQIAPRLNAVGRLGDASPCVELLITHKPDKAAELARFVDEKNVERKEIVEQMTKEIKNLVDADKNSHSVIVLANKNWHQGVLGIVASRIVEYTNKPTLLFTIDEDNNQAKGSARSIDGFNLYEAFTQVEELFSQFGGHYMAAGMTVEVENLSEIQLKLSEIFDKSEEVVPTKLVDAYVPLDRISTDNIKGLDQLRPYGTGNKKPLIAIEDVTVLQKRRIGKDQNHLKLLVGKESAELDIVSFQKGHLDDLLYEQQSITVAGSLEINEWNGISKPQMFMEDVKVSGALLVDNRLSKLSPEDFSHENTDYIFFEDSMYNKLKKTIPDSSQAILIATVDEALSYQANRNMILVDCPTSIEQFQQIMTNNEDIEIRCYFYKESHLFLNGLPNREDFASLYKFITKYKNIDLKKNGHILAERLNIHPNKVLLIVQVFLEANFVIIDNGVLNRREHSEKVNIQTTDAYQKAQKQMEAEQLFIYSSFKEIIEQTEL